MGWRADQAYEEAREKDFREWKASLSLSEYWLWQARRWGPFFGGVAVGAVLSVATLCLV
jgi:hypothetical protein